MLKQSRHFLTALSALALLLRICTAVAATPSSKQANAGAVDVSTLLGAEVDAVGIRRNTNVRQDAIDIVRLDGERAVLLQQAPQNRKNNVARIIRLSDGCELREKLIAVHAVNDGGFDTIDAMQAFAGHIVALAGTNAEIVVWDANTDQIRYLTKKLEDTRVDKLEFAADGRLIVAAHGLQVWDLNSGLLMFDRPNTGPFALDRKGNLIVATDDGFDELDGRTYQLVKHIPYAFARDPHVGITQTPVEMTELADGRILEQAYTGQIRLWDFDSQPTSASIRPVWIIPAFSNGRWGLNATYHPGGYIIASDDGILRVFNASSGSLRSKMKSAGDGQGDSLGFAPLPHGQIVTFQTNGIKFWNAARGRSLKTFANPLTNYGEEGMIQSCSSQASPAKGPVELSAPAQTISASTGDQFVFVTDH